MITKDLIKTHLATLRLQRADATQRVAEYEYALWEARAELNRIKGSISMCKTLMPMATNSLSEELEEKMTNGSKHSR